MPLVPGFRDQLEKCSAMSQDCAAEEIADELLFKTGKALISGDFDSFRGCFGLPHLIETEGGRRLLKTEDDLREVFEDVRRYYEADGITDVARTVVEARFLNADTIGSTHVTRLLKPDGPILRNPFPVYSVIRRHGHLDWRIMTSVYAILDCPAHNAALVSSEGVKSG